MTCPAIKKYQKSDMSIIFTDADIYLWDSISINQMAMNKTSFNQFQLHEQSAVKFLTPAGEKKAKRNTAR